MEYQSKNTSITTIWNQYNYPSEKTKYIKKIQVRNAGMSGYTLDQYHYCKL